MIPASKIVTAGRGESLIVKNSKIVTAGRGAAPEDMPAETRSAETAPAADTEPTQATAGRGNFFSKYKTPILIGGGLLAIFFIYKMSKKK